jgi:hypothetical protein
MEVPGIATGKGRDRSQRALGLRQAVLVGGPEVTEHWLAHDPLTGLDLERHLGQPRSALARAPRQPIFGVAVRRPSIRIDECQLGEL